MGEGVAVISETIAAASTRDLNGSELDVFVVYPARIAGKDFAATMKEARIMYALYLLIDFLGRPSEVRLLVLAQGRHLQRTLLFLQRRVQSRNHPLLSRRRPKQPKTTKQNLLLRHRLSRKVTLQLQEQKK